MDKLMEKLMVAKAIMDKTENIKRGEVRELPLSESISDFEIPQAKYNIPKEFMADSQNNISTKSVKQPTVDAIKNSKLPDEIKKLMIENPINIPQSTSVTLSDDLVERASKLMRKNDSSITENIKLKTENIPSSEINYKLIKKMIEDSVNKALKENGLIIESTEKSNESFSFRVGKHIFEGKVTKIKKIQE
jgi:6-pyruvoyl-tetrahydropterin synthase